MFTVVIFWQEKQLNEEIDWFLDRDKDEICILSVDYHLNNKLDIDGIRKTISRWVCEREQWRLFLIDNYSYQCASYSKYSKQTSCCCCKSECTKEKCGMGRNPFISTEKIACTTNKKHRKQLLELLDGILQIPETKFVQPKDMFVIAVRDGAFSCKQEISVPNFGGGYWEIGEEFPATCRYLIYDIYQIYKGLYERELYWLYCLILLLSENELYMGQMLSGYVYRIEVEYSLNEYYKYLDLRRRKIDEQLEFLEEQRVQYEMDGCIRESTLFPYPITLYDRKKKLKNTLKAKSGSDEWNKRKREIEDEIYDIYHDVSKEYEEQWEKLHLYIGEDDGENAEIFKREKELYENQLLDMNFQNWTVGFFERVKEEKEILEELHTYFKKCERYEKGKVKIRYIFIWIVVLSAVQIVFFGHPCNYKIGGWEIFSYIACALFSGIGYRAYIWNEQRKNRKKINQLLESVDEYQEWLENERKGFLSSTRNAMIYWKRIGNLRLYKEEIRKKKLEISRKEKEYQKKKERLDAFWSMGQGEAEVAIKTVRKYQKEKDIYIGSNVARSEFTFIEKVEFLRKEKRRERNT